MSEALLEAVRSGVVVPLRGSYVLELAAAGLALPSRADLPPAACWTAEDLGALLYNLYEAVGEPEGRS